MDMESRFILRKIITDFMCLLVVGLPILLFYIFGQPYERGFFCDDESLRHPFKPSTITSAMLYIIGMFLPISTFMIAEYIHFRESNGQAVKTLFGRTVHPWVWRCYQIIGVFGFGVACSHLITDVAKYSIGRLRPHFFDVCDPMIDCTNSSNHFRYILNFKCRNTDANLLKEMRLSFPSGHSSFSAYTMVFLALYLQARMTWHGSKLLKHFLQYACILVAVVTACSRVSDYKHHWSDVLAGSLQGAIVAIIVVLFISDLFSYKQTCLPVADAEAPEAPANCGTNRIC